MNIINEISVNIKKNLLINRKKGISKEISKNLINFGIHFSIFLLRKYLFSTRNLV